MWACQTETARQLCAYLAFACTCEFFFQRRMAVRVLSLAAGPAPLCHKDASSGPESLSQLCQKGAKLVPESCRKWSHWCCRMPTSPPCSSWPRLQPSWPRLGQLPAMLLRCAGKLGALLVHSKSLLKGYINTGASYYVSTCCLKEGGRKARKFCIYRLASRL